MFCLEILQTMVVWPIEASIQVGEASTGFGGIRSRYPPGSLGSCAFMIGCIRVHILHMTAHDVQTYGLVRVSFLSIHIVLNLNLNCQQFKMLPLRDYRRVFVNSTICNTALKI